jgi:hypothetical protein
VQVETFRSLNPETQLNSKLIIADLDADEFAFSAHQSPIAVHKSKFSYRKQTASIRAEESGCVQATFAVFFLASREAFSSFGRHDGRQFRGGGIGHRLRAEFPDGRDRTAWL